MQRLTLLAIGLVGVLLGGAVAHAQFNSGVEGTVRDPMGAGIPHAAVSITNVQQGTSRSARSNDAGYFRIQSLAPGTYQVQITSGGFKTWTATELPLQAGEFRTLAPSLEVGASSSTVTVSAQAAGINLENADMDTVLQSRTLLQTPLMGNTVYSMAAIGPGVTGGPTGNGANFGGGTAGGGAAGDNYTNGFYAGVNAAGQRQDSTNFTFDGAWIDLPTRGDQALVSPNPEIVDQMQVSVTEYSATKGRNSGANLGVVTKSGTNHWHGSGSWGFTNDGLSAKTEFATSVPAFTRNEYGATLGGPIIKDKTFIFGAFSQLRESAPTSGVATVETQEFANYVETTFPNSPQATFFKLGPPQHYPNCASSNCTLVGALQSQSYFPDPAIPSSLNALGKANYSYSVPRDGLQWNIRVDQYLGERDRIFGNYLRASATGSSADARPTLNFVPVTATNLLTFNYTHTFSPTLLNEAGFAWVNPYGASQPTPTFQLPYITVGSGVSGSGEWGPGNYSYQVLEWRDVLSKTIKNHELKFGYEAQTEGENDNQSGGFNRPAFTFQSLLDFAQGKAISENGTPINLETSQASNLFIIDRTFYTGIFAQDTWKFNPRLTLTAGLRYDDYGHFVNNATPTSFLNLGSGSNINEQIANASIGPPASNPSGKHVNLVPHRLWELNPRFGFAYDVFGNGRTAIRGGGGLYSDKLPDLNIMSLLRSNLPFSYTPSVSVLQGQSPAFALCSPPQGYSVSCPLLIPKNIEFDSHGGIVGNRSSLGGWSPDVTTGQVEIWSLGIQQQLRNDLILELDYIGSAGHHLSETTDINRYAGDLVAHDGQQNRLNQSFGSMSFARTDGNSIANLGSAMVTKAISHNYNLRGVYTWSKVLDYPSSSDDTGNVVGGSSNLVDAQDIRLMRGRAAFDVRQRLTIDGVWTLPNPWASGWKAATLGGWRVGTIGIFQSGLPFTVITTNSYASGLGDFNADGTNYDFPNTPIFGNHLKGQSKRQFLNGLFPASAFPLPTPGSGEGNLRRNTFDEPGYANLDLNAEKIFLAPWFDGEKVNLELRGEAFNLFNRVNLNSVDGNLADASSSFAHAQGQYAPRLFQFKLRAQF
jgi:hypothetical protein